MIIIAAQPGTNWFLLRSALNTHPQLTFSADIFNGVTFGRQLKKAGISYEMMTEANENFCMEVYDYPDLEGAWPYWNLQTDLQEDLCDNAVEARGVCITRKDKLAQAIDWFDPHRGLEVKGPPFTVDPIDVAAVIKRFKRADSMYHRLFSDRTQVTFEDMDTMLDAVLVNVQQFLDVPHRPLRPQVPIPKITPLHRRVLNWNDVVGALKSSKYAEYLEGHRLVRD